MDMNGPVRIPTEPERPTVVEQPLAPKPKPKKIHRILNTLIMVIALVLAGVAGYFVYKLSHSTKDDMTQMVTSTASTAPTAATLQYVTKLATSIQSKDYTVSSLGTGEDFSAPYRKLDGVDYLVGPSPNSSYGFSFEDVTNGVMNEVTSNLDKSFTTAGFTKRVLIKYDSSINNTDPSIIIGQTVYDDSDYSCGVDQYATDTNKADVPTFSVYVGCSSVADYTSSATAMKPFFDAVTAAKSTSSNLKSLNAEFFSTLELSMPTITASKTAGYHLASSGATNEGGIYGSDMLFYQTPDNTWHFFTHAEDGPYCSDFNTPDLKKAYLGTDCRDVDNNSNTAKVTL